MIIKVHEVLSVYWTLNPIYYFVRIFGLAPYKVELTNKRAYWRVSKLSLLYTVFFFIVVMMCVIPICQHILDTIRFKDLDKIEMYADSYRRIILAVICMICVILSIENRHKTCKLMNKLNDFDLDLMSRGIKLNHEEMRMKNMTLVVVICVLFSISVGLDLTAVFLHESVHLYRLANVLLFIVCHSSQVQFVGFVLVLQRRFAVLNKYINNLNDNTLKKHTDRRVRQTEVTNHNHGIHTPIITLSGAGVTSNVIGARATKFKSNPISVTCDFHYRLCEWAKSLNSLFSIQILLCTGISTIVLVIYLYIFYLMLSRNEKYKYNIKDTFRLLIWGSWYFSMIIGTSYICDKTRDEANKVNALLHRIEYDKNDEETKTHIEMFSLQMQHQKVDFSAGGVFVVDLCSLRNIVASVTTYLVFFIQFEMASRSKLADKSLH